VHDCLAVHHLKKPMIALDITQQILPGRTRAEAEMESVQQLCGMGPLAK
jgi:hypothetical protein